MTGSKIKTNIKRKRTLPCHRKPRNKGPRGHGSKSNDSDIQVLDLDGIRLDLGVKISQT
jgi:hypothetical protein